MAVFYQRKAEQYDPRTDTYQGIPSDMFDALGQVTKSRNYAVTEGKLLGKDEKYFRTNHDNAGRDARRILEQMHEARQSYLNARRSPYSITTDL